MSYRRITRDNAATLRCLGQAQFGWIAQARWSPRGDMLAIAGGDGIAIYADDFGGAPSWRLTAHTAPVKDIAFSPDGRMLASSSADTTVKLWAIAAGAVSETATLRGHTGSVEALAFSPDGRLLASGASDHSIRLWDAASGAPLAELPGHDDELTALVFDATWNASLFSGGRDRRIYAWRIQAGFPRQLLGEHDDWIRDLALQPRSAALASGSKDMTIRLWQSRRRAARRRRHSGSRGRSRLPRLHTRRRLAGQRRTR